MASRWTWPAVFHAQQMAVSGGTQYVRVGGQGPAVLLLHGFGDTGDMWAPLAEIAGAGPHRHRSRPARHGPLVPSGGRLRKDRAGARPRRHAGQARRRRTSSWSPTTSATWSATPSRRSIPQRVTRWVVMDAPLPGHRPLGRSAEEPEDLALQLPRAGRRAAGRRPRAHLARPLLQRAVGQPGRHRRGDARALRRALRPAGRDPRRVRGQFAAFAQDAIDNQALLAQGQADHAGAGDRRRPFLRRPAGDRSRLRRRPTCAARSSAIPATGSWRSSRSRRSPSSLRSWKRKNNAEGGLRLRAEFAVPHSGILSRLAFAPHLRVTEKRRSFFQ